MQLFLDRHIRGIFRSSKKNFFVFCDESDTDGDDKNMIMIFTTQFLYYLS